jgi:tetratricopeptide (TPR) repeat protein
MAQIQGAGTDPRSDLYSLGATLYHFVTGAAPQDALTRATAAVDGQPDPLRAACELNGQVSSSVAGVIQKALTLSRNQRHVSATEMRSAMRAACDVTSAVAFQDTAVIGAPRIAIPAKERESDAPALPALAHLEIEKAGLSANSLSHDVPMLIAAEVGVEKAEPESPDQETALRMEGIADARVRELVSAGAAAFDAREYALALGHWEAALKLSPGEPGIKESIDSARRLIRKEEGRKARVSRLVTDGTEDFDAKRYELAIEKWNWALTLSPNEPGVEASVRAARAALKKEAGRQPKVEHQVKVKLLVSQGAQAFDTGNYELAIHRWTNVLRLSPDEPGVKKSIETASQKRRELLEKANKQPRSKYRSIDGAGTATPPKQPSIFSRLRVPSLWRRTETAELAPSERAFFRMLGIGIVTAALIFLVAESLAGLKLTLVFILPLLVIAGIFLWTSIKR